MKHQCVRVAMQPQIARVNGGPSSTFWSFLPAGIEAMERGSRNAAVLASTLVFLCIVLWALLLAFPYWSYALALHTVCTAILTPCCLLLPVVFFFGYGARSGEAQALHEVATEARIRIQALKRGYHQQHSHHEPAQSAAPSATSPEVAESGAQPEFHESRGHHHDEPGETATPHADPLHMTHVGAQSGHQHSDGAQPHRNPAEPSQPAASPANAPPSSSSEAPPGSQVKQEAHHESSHSGISQDPVAASNSSRAAHMEDSPVLQTGLSGPLQEQRGRPVPSRAEQSKGCQHLDSLPGQHSTTVTPLLGAAGRDDQDKCNGRQETHSPAEQVSADANGHADHQQQSAGAQPQQAASFPQRPPDMPSPEEEPSGAGGETAAESETTAAHAGHEGTHAGLKRLIDVPSSDEPAFKKPSYAAGALCQGADGDIRQLSHDVSEQPEDCATSPVWSSTSQRGTDTSTPQDSRHFQMQVDVPARPRSPFDRLRLEALVDGPSDGAPEPFPNADTFRANIDCSPQQADFTDRLSISRQQQDSFSFPPLIEGVPVRRRSPAVSMEPTRAAAGAFGSSVLNYDHQLQQRPGLLTAPSPSVPPGPALTSPSLGSDHALEGLASEASWQASPTSASAQQAAANKGMSPAHTPGALLPLAPQHVKPYGHIRSGRLGEEGEGSDSSATSSPVFSQGNGSPMQVRTGGQDVGFTHESVTPGRSPSPLGVIRAGRLGE